MKISDYSNKDTVEKILKEIYDECITKHRFSREEIKTLEKNMSEVSDIKYKKIIPIIDKRGIVKSI